MKRSFLITITALLAVFTSCKEEVSDLASGGGTPISMKITANFTGLDAAQVIPTALGLYGNAADWSSVPNYIENKKMYNAKYVYKPEGGNFEGSLKWASANGIQHRLMAYAPYTEALNFENVSKIGGSLPRVQLCDVQSAWASAAKYNFMYGVADGLSAGSNVQIDMKSPFSILKFQIKNQTTESITITNLDMKSSQQNDILTCDYLIHLGVPEPKIQLSEAVKAPAAALEIKNGTLAPDAAYDAYMVINASDLTASILSIVVETPNGNFSTSIDGFNLKQATCYNVPLAIDKLILEPPVAETIVVADGGEQNKAYLGKKVTITGTSISKIEKLTLGEVEITPSSLTSSELVFNIPESYDFDEATDCNLVATYNSKFTEKLATLKVYPFYFYKDVVIGAQGADKAKAFFLPNTGTVISTDEWANVDTKASGTVHSGSNILNKSELTNAADYYSVPPYILTTSSALSKGMWFVSPGNSKAMLANFKKADGTAMTSGKYGTPILAYKRLDDNLPFVSEIKSGEITSIGFETLNQVGTSGYPEFKVTPTTTVQFTVGSVMLVQYVSYSYGKLTGLPLSGVNRSGYLHIKSISNIDSGTGLPQVTSQMTFDFYWSKEINK